MCCPTKSPAQPHCRNELFRVSGMNWHSGHTTSCNTSGLDSLPSCDCCSHPWVQSIAILHWQPLPELCISMNRVMKHLAVGNLTAKLKQIKDTLYMRVGKRGYSCSETKSSFSPASKSATPRLLPELKSQLYQTGQEGL